ncbi:MAG: GGIII-like transmembrane region-containing protein, partial [Candidatus Thermoplasmatota archaeon]|nr:GGIII-like transmembrane region-containing protein [Candidatus Thermoplasmatota archaeon]
GSISPNECSYGETVLFKGSATGGSGTYTRYLWRSDIDGSISNKAEFTANNLSVGDHIIYFKVQDSKERWSSEVTGSVTIRMDDDAPLAEIISIIPSPAYTGDGVSFMGKGSGGTGVFIEFRWRSDRDGLLSDSDTFTSSSLSPGRHIIYYSVRDSASLWSPETTRELQVMDTDAAPVASIENIHPNPSVQDGEITFIGRGEARTGEVVEYIWSSDIDGELARVASFKIKSLSVGHHIISLRVRDSGTRLSPPFQSLLVVEGKEGAPVARIEHVEPSPAIQGNVVTFRGRGSNGSGQYDEYSWRSALDGFLSDDPEFEKILSKGNHTIYFKLKDSLGLWSSEVSRELTVRSSKDRLSAYLKVIPDKPIVGEPVTFKSINHREEAYEFLFVFGNGETTEWITEEETIYEYSQAGTYIARLQLRNAEGGTGDFILLEVNVKEKEMTESIGGNVSDQVSGWYYYLLAGIGVVLLLIIVLLIVVSRRKSKKRSIIEDLEPQQIKIDYTQTKQKLLSDATGRVGPPKPGKYSGDSKEVVPKFPETYDHMAGPKTAQPDLLLPELSGVEPVSVPAFPAEKIMGKFPAEYNSQAYELTEKPFLNIIGKKPEESDLELPVVKRGKKLPKIIREVITGDAKLKNSKRPRIVREIRADNDRGKKAPRIVLAVSPSDGSAEVPTGSRKQATGKKEAVDMGNETESVGGQKVLNGKTKERLDFLIHKFQNASLVRSPPDKLGEPVGIHTEGAVTPEKCCVTKCVPAGSPLPVNGSEKNEKAPDRVDSEPADIITPSGGDQNLEGDVGREARSWFDDLKSRHGEKSPEKDEGLPELIPE